MSPVPDCRFRGLPDLPCPCRRQCAGSDVALTWTCVATRGVYAKPQRGAWAKARSDPPLACRVLTALFSRRIIRAPTGARTRSTRGVAAPGCDHSPHCSRSPEHEFPASCPSPPSYRYCRPVAGFARDHPGPGLACQTDTGHRSVFHRQHHRHHRPHRGRSAGRATGSADHH